MRRAIRARSRREALGRMTARFASAAWRRPGKKRERTSLGWGGVEAGGEIGTAPPGRRVRGVPATGPRRRRVGRVDVEPEARSLRVATQGIHADAGAIRAPGDLRSLGAPDVDQASL